MPAAKKCPRCSAECICRKKRRKPRVGRAARSKPMYMPPPTQNLFFGQTPSVQQALQFRPEVIPVPKLSFDMMTQTEAVAPPARVPGPPPGSPPLRPRPRVAGTPMETQTEDITLAVGGGRLPLPALEAMVESGEKVLSLRPAKYRPRERREAVSGDTLEQVREGMEQIAARASMIAAEARERSAPLARMTAEEAARLPTSGEPGALQKMREQQMLLSLARDKEREFERRPSVSTTMSEPGSVAGGAAGGGAASVTSDPARLRRYVLVRDEDGGAAAGGGAAGGGGEPPLPPRFLKRKPKVAQTPAVLGTVPEEVEGAIDEALAKVAGRK